MELTTSDLGLALRDHLEGKLVHRFDTRDGHETDDCAQVGHIDVSDASNPVLYVNGQTFVLRIERGRR